MVWKKDLTAITKGGTISKHAHKGYKSQPLGRNGMATLHDGMPGHRANNDYGKRPTQPAVKIPSAPSAEDMHDDKAFHLASDDGMPVPPNDHDEDDE
jgi:hypothetical protein